MKRLWTLVFICIILVLLYFSTIPLLAQEIPFTDGFDFPIGDPNTCSPHSITQKFQETDPSLYYIPGHLGEDRSANTDTPVKACSNGLVTFSSNGGKGWGDIIRIAHRFPNGNIVYSIYAHLSWKGVNSGDIVKRGQVIGLSGIMGTGPHLHYEIKTKDEAGPGYSKQILPLSSDGSLSFNGTTYYNPSLFIPTYRFVQPIQPPKPPPPAEVKIKPQKQKKKAVTILINASKTMVPFSKQLAQQAKLIVDTVEDGTALKVSTFTSATSDLSYEPVIIKENQDREKIKRRIDEVLDHNYMWLFSLLTGTDHDTAFQAALKSLKEPGIQNRDRTIYLLTDGAQVENIPKSLVKDPKLEYKNTHKQIKEEGIRLKIIGIGNVDQDFLRRMIDESEGEFEIVSKERKLPWILIPWKQKEVRFEKLVHLMLNQITEYEFEIPYQDYYTIISLLWDHTELEIIVTDPYGKEITTNSNNQDITLIQDPTYKLYKIETPTPGKYKIRVKAIQVPLEGEDIQIFATSQVDKTPPKIKVEKLKKTYSKNPIIFKIKADDKITKTTNIQIRYKGKKQSWKQLPAKKKGDFWEVKWKPKKNGSYSIGIAAFDQFGNTATLRKEVKIKIPPPKKKPKPVTILDQILLFLKNLLKSIGLSK